MSQYKTFTYYLILLILLAGLGYVSWYIYTHEQPKVDLGSSLPLFEISDYRLIRYDKVSGNRLYTIESPYMHHFDDARGSFLITPLLTHYVTPSESNVNPTLSPSIMDWTAQSKEAIITNDSSLITMNENVVLNRKDLKTDEITTLKTSQLFIHDKGEVVKSDQFVTIRTYPNNILEGIGLLGYPNIGQFNLLDNIESYYETKKK